VGTSGQPNRSRVLVWLAGFVVAFAAVSFVVSGGVGRLLSQQPRSEVVALTPSSKPPVCRSDQLQIYGAFSDCADIAKSFCDVLADTLDNVFILGGAAHEFTLNIGVAGGFLGTGTYVLSNGGGEADIRDNTTNAYWLSTTGDLTVTADNGRSGTVQTILDPVAGIGDQSSLPLHMRGSWSCA
jgi:hypothetical protein